MRQAKIITVTLTAILLAPVIGHADPFDPKRVPTDARWVAHADLDAARDTKSFDAFCDKMLSTNEAQTQLAQIEKITGMKIPDDLHDFTLFGKDSGDEAGVVLVHGKIDRDKTVASLQFADQFSSIPYGAYSVLTWLDKDKNQTMFGAFHDESHLVIGRSEKNIELALDTVDAKAEALKADSPLVTGAKPQLLLYVAAKDVPQLHAANAQPNPIVASVQTAWISMSEKDDIVTLRAELEGASADTAADLRQSLDGLRGILGLAARGDNADPLAKAVVAASRTFTTTQKDKTVNIDWPMPVEQVQNIISAIAEKQTHKN